MPTRTAPAQSAPAVRLLRRALHNPGFQVVMGMAVFLIGLAELVEELFALALPAPDAHHGLLILGAVIALRGLVDVIEGAEHVALAAEARGAAEPPPPGAGP